MLPPRVGRRAERNYLDVTRIANSSRRPATISLSSIRNEMLRLAVRAASGAVAGAAMLNLSRATCEPSPSERARKILDAEFTRRGASATLSVNKVVRFNFILHFFEIFVELWRNSTPSCQITGPHPRRKSIMQNCGP